jgi:hypothetical protein
MRIKIKLKISYNNNNSFDNEYYNISNNNLSLRENENQENNFNYKSIKSFKNLGKYFINNFELNENKIEKIEKIFFDFHKKDTKFIYPINLKRTKTILELKKNLQDFLNEFYYKIPYDIIKLFPFIKINFELDELRFDDYFLFNDFKIKEIIQENEKIM